MKQRNWKSLALLVSISAVSLVLLSSALISTIRLPLLSWQGLAPMFALVLLTFGASRFTVTMTSADGSSQGRKSVADTFVFLAVMLYAIPPASTAGPATLLAAVVGFVSFHGMHAEACLNLHYEHRGHFPPLLPACSYRFLVAWFMLTGHLDLTREFR